MQKYQPSTIEAKWQKKWQEEGIYDPELGSDKKFYVLAEFPYPSGDLHMGHWFTFGGADIYARFKRKQGYSVFFPNGFDAFGLPAENAAIKRDIHPRDWTYANIERMKQQFSTMGGSFSYKNQVVTCDPEYYHWNQWIFLKMFEKGIAYKDKFQSNWCPSCQTVLANEGVESGKCWRCGSEVVQRAVDQWFFKITDYADKLLWPAADKEGFSNNVKWPQSVREGQNNWIGRSEGLVFSAPVKDSDMVIQTFSTHFEAFYADTFVVIAPDHPILEELVSDVPNKKEILDFANGIVNKRKDENYQVTGKDIEGIFTGKYIVDPIGNGDLPIWVASFALKDYGTGIVKCSAHDERDFAFAKKYNLRLKPVIFPEDPDLRKKVEDLELLFVDMKNGILSEPAEFEGKQAGPLRQEIADYAVKKGFAKKSTQYHLHDWSVSRQRYWGTPIPIIYCDHCGTVPVPEKDLPVELPYEVDYTPKGKSPLASNEAWLNVKCPRCNKMSKRDADTLDTFVDSSWYFFRYVSPHFEKGSFDSELAKKVMPVDIYFGGAEHTLGHTLYSRFFTKFLKELGLTDLNEYALARVNHGIVLGPDGNKMSKSKGNVVNPDDEVKRFGADAVRVYLAFFMPYEGTGPWISDRIWGAYRFLERVWDLKDKVDSSNDNSDPKDLFEMHKTINKVTSDLESIKFNTAVAALMEWLNYLTKKEKVSVEEYKTLVQLLSPVAPHISEELWFALGEKGSIHTHLWPAVAKEHLVADKIKLAVQVNGKVRDIIEVDWDKIEDEEYVKDLAFSSAKVGKFVSKESLKRIVYVPGKVLSLVV